MNSATLNRFAGALLGLILITLSPAMDGRAFAQDGADMDEPQPETAACGDGVFDAKDVAEGSECDGGAHCRCCECDTKEFPKPDGKGGCEADPCGSGTYWSTKHGECRAKESSKKKEDPKPAAAVCGNGVVETGESCDDGNVITETDCPYGQSSCLICNASCQVENGQANRCGDGNLDSEHETCDDGNAITETCSYGVESCEVCNSQCELVQGIAAFCGDGNSDANEECDDGNNVTEECDYGNERCRVCNSQCSLAWGAANLCGDGNLDFDEGEQCDSEQGCDEQCRFTTETASVDDETTDGFQFGDSHGRLMIGPHFIFPLTGEYDYTPVAKLDFIVEFYVYERVFLEVPFELGLYFRDNTTVMGGAGLGGGYSFDENWQIVVGVVGTVWQAQYEDNGIEEPDDSENEETVFMGYSYTGFQYTNDWFTLRAAATWPGVSEVSRFNYGPGGSFTAGGKLW